MPNTNTFFNQIALKSCVNFLEMHFVFSVLKHHTIDWYFHSGCKEDSFDKNMAWFYIHWICSVIGETVIWGFQSNFQRETNVLKLTDVPNFIFLWKSDTFSWEEFQRPPWWSWTRFIKVFLRQIILSFEWNFSCSMF